MIAASRVGIFGGRFDPVHRAHVAMAQAAADQLHLKEVIWMVSANAVHKPIVASAEHRMNMVRIALESLGDLRMKVDDREIRAAQQGEDNPSFKTLQSLKQERPHEQWVWILGEDQLQAFTSWQRWEWLIQNMALAVCARPGVSEPTKTADQNAGWQMPAALSALGARVTFIDLAADAVSSSQVRANIASGLAINNLVPQSVANYLLAHPVYRPPEQA